ncbi:hypothetical protein DSO57_1015980 [Entomophthora muscae]|uniref:Uncharacterized protein n=1 Tax=Entomophthora muscae TaxID=34485 RepID=A0ACC2U422_9FUNG|nr:hypothetical protein DSO57_1015980 [Entomophthora muscae]
MTKKLGFEELCDLSPGAWDTYVHAFYESPKDSVLVNMVQEYTNDNRLYSQENKHLWLNLADSLMPELLVYLALISHKRSPVCLGWLLDALEASLYVHSEGPQAVCVADRISTALQCLSAPQSHYTQILPFFASPPQETSLICSLTVTWLEVFRQINANQSEYYFLYGILHKRPSSQQVTNPISKKEKQSNFLTPEYFSTPCPFHVNSEWVALCHRGLALWQETASDRDPNVFRHMVQQVISDKYPAKKMSLLDYVLGLWMLTQPDRSAWVLEPLFKLVAESNSPAGLFLQLFDIKSYSGSGTFCFLLSQSYSSSQMEAMALRLIHHSLTLILSQPKDKIPHNFLKVSLDRIPPGALEDIAHWGVTQLDIFATSKQEMPLIYFENVMDHVPTAVMLRQVLLLRPDAPNSPTVRLEMIPRLNPNIGSLLWGVGNDTSLSLGASHQMVLAMIQDNSACPHSAFPNFFAGVLRLMVSTPPASLLPLHKWTNLYLIPTILAKHPLNPGYATSLLLTLLRDITLFDLLMAGSDLKVPSLTNQMNLAELLSSELDSIAQLCLAHSWIALWAENSPLIWKWKMILISCFPLSSLAANVATGLLESIQPSCLETIPTAQNDMYSLMSYVFIAGGCPAMFPLVYHAIQRLTGSIDSILFCIEDTMLSSFLASGVPALEPGLATKFKESLMAILNTCMCITEDQAQQDFALSLQTQLIPRMVLSYTLHQALLSIFVSSWYDLSSKDPSTRAFCQHFLVTSCKLLIYFLEHLNQKDHFPQALQSLYNIPYSAHHPAPLSVLNLNHPSQLLCSSDIAVTLYPLLEKLKNLLPSCSFAEFLCTP